MNEVVEVGVPAVSPMEEVMRVKQCALPRVVGLTGEGGRSGARPFARGLDGTGNS
jgi:hypothetical protein